MFRRIHVFFSHVQFIPAVTELNHMNQHVASLVDGPYTCIKWRNRE